jgi:outer membrane protein assembly factor BamB
MWTFSPPPFAGRKERVEHAITSPDGIIVAGVRGQSPVLHRIDATDARTLWTFDSRADIARTPWPTAAHGIVMFVDDGVNVLDHMTGTHSKIALDYWGPSLADEARFYVANTWQEEGPGLFVGAFDASAKPMWKGDKFQARGIVISEANGIALDGGVLFHAANYHFAKQSFLTAIDPRTGAVRWKTVTVPASAPSAAGGRVYLVEQSPKPGHVELVARSQKDGSVLWAVPLNQARASAPVIAGGLIIVQDDAGVTAFNAEIGTQLWRVLIASKPSASRNATSLAAAMGSDTLLVTGGGQVHLIALANGNIQWRGAPQAGANDVHSPIIASDAAYVVADGALVRLSGPPV